MPAFEPTFDLHAGGGARPPRSPHRLPLGDLALQFAREIRVHGFGIVLGNLGNLHRLSLFQAAARSTGRERIGFSLGGLRGRPSNAQSPQDPVDRHRSLNILRARSAGQNAIAEASEALYASMARF